MRPLSELAGRLYRLLYSTFQPCAEDTILGSRSTKAIAVWSPNRSLHPSMAELAHSIMHSHEPWLLSLHYVLLSRHRG
jgi:hypothetical protein